MVTKVNLPVLTPPGITKVTLLAETTVKFVMFTPLKDIDNTPARFEPFTVMMAPTVAAVGLTLETDGVTAREL